MFYFHDLALQKMFASWPERQKSFLWVKSFLVFCENHCPNGGNANLFCTTFEEKNPFLSNDELIKDYFSHVVTSNFC